MQRSVNSVLFLMVHTNRVSKQDIRIVFYDFCERLNVILLKNPVFKPCSGEQNKHKMPAYSLFKIRFRRCSPQFGSFQTIFSKRHRTLVVRVFSASRHFFKTNVTQSVAELIQNSQKTWNCGHFLPNLVN